MSMLLRANAIRAIEAAHATGTPGVSLMTRAAEAAAGTAMKMCQSGGRILVLAGPGNNGGDAWVAAHLLQSSWYSVTVLALGEPRAVEAVHARTEFVSAGGTVLHSWPDLTRVGCDLIIDGLLGIGLSRAASGVMKEWIENANMSGRPILALDVPSGLNADTGTRRGACIRATRTITFIADKPGLHTAAGPDLAGVIEVAHLAGKLNTLPATGSTEQGELQSRNTPPVPLPVRELDCHKGHHGSVGVLGAARGMAGAGVLAARAALFSGAGKVFLAPLDEELRSLDWLQPEVMFRRPREVLDDSSLTALVVGPGMGATDSARTVLESAMKLPRPLVLDADALNLIARGRALQTALKRRYAHSATILTPHPAEAARLLNVDTTTVNADRIDAALTIAQRFAAIVVLKGAGSIIAAPEGAWFVNDTGNPGMATGGMGDVLSGVIGALVGQSLTGEDSGTKRSPVSATRLAVWVHGMAADHCVAHGAGPIGLTPTEVLHACRYVLNGGTLS